VSLANVYAMPLSRAVAEMERLMELPENRRKMDWTEIEPEALMADMLLHAKRLQEAIEHHRHAVARLEAANVANLAWMAADSAAADGHPAKP
jgi:hypothetical protein